MTVAKPASDNSGAWLEEVRVRDLALLEGVTFTLDPHLNVVSGETGEGKSLLLLAVGLVLGGRARKGLVRRGASEAVVEARFRTSGVDLSGVTDLLEPGAVEVCLRRTVAEDGHSRAYVNGSLVPVSVLATLGERLVDVHGQRHSLLRAVDQRRVLDRFAKCESLLAQWREAHDRLWEARDRLQRRLEDEAEREKRAEYLEFQLRELREADPRPGEEQELEDRLRLLSASESLDQILAHAAARLTEDDGAVGEDCARWARELADTGAAESGDLGLLVERLRNLSAEADDLGRECARLRARLESDPEELQTAENRLRLLRHLARRHRVSADDLADLRRRLEDEWSGLQSGADEEELRRGEQHALSALRIAGQALLLARQQGAARLEKAIKPALAELRMERARVQVLVEPPVLPDSFDLMGPSPDGPGPVTFLVAANPGEPEQPLERVASGGELARILLALKGALAGAHRIPLLIFDEIDAGIGGRVGLPFGRRISAIARHHQVLVVTHLPQVAAFADRHLGVRKEVTRGRTRTVVELLEGDRRIDELAAMLGGPGDSGDAQAAARQQAVVLLGEAAL